MWVSYMISSAAPWPLSEQKMRMLLSYNLDWMQRKKHTLIWQVASNTQVEQAKGEKESEMDLSFTAMKHGTTVAKVI